MAEKGSYESKDIAEGKIKPNQIGMRYIILYDMGKAENLSRAINILAKEGWTVKGCWGGVNINAFMLLEKA